MCRMDCRGQEGVDRDPTEKADKVVLAGDDGCLHQVVALIQEMDGVALIATPFSCLEVGCFLWCHQSHPG